MTIMKNWLKNTKSYFFKLKITSQRTTAKRPIIHNQSNQSSKCLFVIDVTL